MKKVIVITGVTGSGKSELAIQLAKKYNGEIINADSVSIYKHLNIGSAKITSFEMENVPHYLHDFLELDQKYDVAQFQKDARSLIDKITDKGKLPIIVGGSGLYINAVVYDYSFPKLELEPLPLDLTNEEMYEQLKNIDPKAADKIHVNNTKRLKRALQIARSYGVRKETIHGNRKNVPFYDSLIFFLSGEREALYERINIRVDRMFEDGLVDEVTQLYQQDVQFFNYSSTNAIGYREFEEYFLGNRSLDEVKRLIQRNTRRFAKRQETWFRNQSDGIIVDVSKPKFKEKIKEEISKFLI